jgi:hypothetical protein
MIFLVNIFRKKYLQQKYSLFKKDVAFSKFVAQKEKTSTQHNWQANF